MKQLSKEKNQFNLTKIANSVGMKTEKSQLNLFKVAAVAGTAMALVSAPVANAATSIVINDVFAKQVTENKSVDLANNIANNEVRWNLLKDLLVNWDTYSAVDRANIMNNMTIVNDGSTFQLYTSADSQVGATVANAPTLRLGAGSTLPTITSNGQILLDVENVTSGTYGGVTTNYAGGTTSGAISVGDAATGAYRTILNVAAGRVEANSTDAINGSQLYAAQKGINKVATDVTNLTTKVNQGFNVTGTSGTDNIQLGDTLTINGASGNIKSTVTNNRVALELGDNLNVTGNVTAGGTFKAGNVTMNSTGVNAAGTKVINVANGTVSATSKDAVNGSQLYATDQNVTNLTNQVNQGWNITNGTTTDNVQLGQTVTYRADDTNVNVNVTNNTVGIGLADNLSITGNYTTTGGTFKAGNVTMNSTGINAAGTKVINVANGTVSATSKDAVNGSQLYAVQSQIANGSSWTISDGTNTDEMKAGQTITYKAGSTNLNTTVTNNTVTFDLGKDLSIAGNYTTTNGTFKAGNVTMNASGIDGGGNKIVDVANGTVNATSTDVVNGSQLYATNQNVTNLSTKVNQGWNITNGTTTDNVQLGETVTYRADDSNINLNLSNNTVAVGLADNVSITGNYTTTNGSFVAGNVTLNSTGVNAGNTKVINVANGTLSATSKDGVNGSQLYATNQNVTNVTNTVSNLSSKVNQGFNISNGSTTDNIQLGETINYTVDNNLKLNLTNNSMAFGLGDNLNVTGNITAGGTIKTGNVTMNSTGINAGNTKVINVANGTLSATSKDAVNGSQLYAVSQNVTNVSNTVAQGLNFTDGNATDNVKLGETVKLSTDANMNVTVTNNTLVYKLQDNLSIAGNYTTTNGTFKAGNVTMNSTGVNAGNTKVINVANGTISATSKDAVNGSQLYNVQSQINNGFAWTITDGTNTDEMRTGQVLTYKAGSTNVVTNVSNNTVTFDLGKDIKVAGNISTGNVTMNSTGINAGNTTITGVKAGNVSANSTDAVNGSQLYATNQNVTNLTTTVNKGFNIGNGTTTDNVQLSETILFQPDDKNIKTSITNNRVGYSLADAIDINTSLTVGTKNITINDNGINAQNTTITGVKAGNVSANSTEAVNGSQLYNVTTSIKNLDDLAVKYDNTNKTSVTMGGVNATKPVSVTNVANGTLSANSTDVVNGSQLYTTNNNVTNLTNTVNKGWNLKDAKGNTSNIAMGDSVTLTNTDKNVNVTVNPNGTATIDLAKDLTVSGNITMNGGGITGVKAGTLNANSTDVVNGSQLYQTNQNVTNLADKVGKGWNLTDDKGNTANIQLGGTVKMGNTDGNINVTVNSNGSTTVDLADSISLTEVKTGNVTMNTGGIDMGDTQITNLKAGTKGTDAVNVNQLNSAVNQLNGRIDQVEDDAKAGTAAAIAVASLGQAWDFGSNTISVAGSAYDGKAGWAVGGSHITDNGRWMLKYNASGSDNDKYGFGASATYQY